MVVEVEVIPVLPGKSTTAYPVNFVLKYMEVGEVTSNSSL